MGIPGVEEWTQTATGTARLAVDVTVVGALAAMPVLATLAVIVDRPFELQAIVPPLLRRWFAGSLRRRRCHERLTAALEHLRLARSSGGIVAILPRALPFGARVPSPPLLAARDLPPRSALLPILHPPSTPIDF